MVDHLGSHEVVQDRVVTRLLPSKQLLDHVLSAARVAAVAARSPSGRWGSPADTAKLVAWLLSDEADWVTGQTIASDGGWSAL